MVRAGTTVQGSAAVAETLIGIFGATQLVRLTLVGTAGGFHTDVFVIAGLTLPWNSGAVEGHVNRIKMLKRQMFGRAGFGLLRKRVLLAP